MKCWKKIIATLTDNGSNFVKAFKEYGIQMGAVLALNSILNVQVDVEDDLDDEGAYREDEDMTEFDDIISQPVTVPEAEDYQYEQNIWLSNNFRCTAHTINLIATTDITNAINKSHSLRLKHANVRNSGKNRGVLSQQKL